MTACAGKAGTASRVELTYSRRRSKVRRARRECAYIADFIGKL